MTLNLGLSPQKEWQNCKFKGTAENFPQNTVLLGLLPIFRLGYWSEKCKINGDVQMFQGPIGKISHPNIGKTGILHYLPNKNYFFELSKNMAIIIQGLVQLLENCSSCNHSAFTMVSKQKVFDQL